jgi:hypothetical protein
MLPLGLITFLLTLTAVYTPKDFILHAALLRQACAHCGIFVTAATRRCPDSVSVPMWRVMLSHPLPVVALVRPLPHQQADRTWTAPGPPELCPQNQETSRDHRVLPALSQRNRSSAAIPESRVRYPCIPHPFATNMSFGYPMPMSVRLACLSHAASVRSEPGSNSSLFRRNTPASPRSQTAAATASHHTQLITARPYLFSAQHGRTRILTTT